MLTRTRPIVCLVTDRRRLGSIWGTSVCDRLQRQAGAAARAGVDLIHVREHDLGAREVVAMVTSLRDATAGTRARILVNERLDVALSAGVGVHLRDDSVPTDRVRAVTSLGLLVGRSVHTSAAADRARNADYLVLGTVFPSASKPTVTQPVGLDALARAACRASSPVLAIGGLTLSHVPAVAKAGAAGIAAIGLFLEPAGAAASPEAAIADLLTAIRSRFGS